MYAADFRKIARDSLRGRWMTAVLTTLLATWLGVFSSGGSVNLNIDVNTLSEFATMLGIENDVLMDSLVKILQVLIPLVAIMSIVSLVQFIISGVIQLGYCSFTLNMVDGKDARLENLFSQMNRFGDGFCLKILTQIFVALWTMLFIIPGIIASYSYAMAPFIMLENPNCGARQALAESKAMMRGNKWRLFCLDFSFIGWQFLCGFTFGIGNLWLNPYMNTSHAAFYREISETGYVQDAPKVTLEF